VLPGFDFSDFNRERDSAEEATPEKNEPCIPMFKNFKRRRPGFGGNFSGKSWSVGTVPSRPPAAAGGLKFKSEVSG